MTMHPSPEEEELDLGVLKRGEVWRHRRTGREAQIIVVPHGRWTIVEYRYLTSLPDDQRRGHTLMVPRVNLTCRTPRSFFAAFEFARIRP